MTGTDIEGLAAALDVSGATARQYLRQSVIVPAGHQVHGAAPGSAGGRLEEHRLRDELAQLLGGITEASLPYGRADVMTSAAVFEVEPAKAWRHGVRQALGYSAQCGLPPAIALFGALMRADDMVKLYDKLQGIGRLKVALWWHDGGRWEHISSRTRARHSRPYGATFDRCHYCTQPVVWLPGPAGERIRHDYDATGPAAALSALHAHHCPGVCGPAGCGCPAEHRRIAGIRARADARRAAAGNPSAPAQHVGTAMLRPPPRAELINDL